MGPKRKELKVKRGGGGGGGGEGRLVVARLPHRTLASSGEGSSGVQFQPQGADQKPDVGVPQPGAGASLLRGPPQGPAVLLY